MLPTIELAPNWKHSLTLRNPLILASGALIDSSAGAIVTVPLTRRARGGAPVPRVVEIPGGFLLRTGAANPGLDRLLRERERVRGHEVSHTPLLVAFAPQGVQDWGLMASRLGGAPGIHGIELLFNPTIDAPSAIRTVRSATELPILAKLDLDQATALAPECVAAGANALVIGRPPRGMVYVKGHPWFGRLYSPAVKPLVFKTLAEVAQLDLHVPLVASGGIHTANDVNECLAAGALAVEIDSAQWLDPDVTSAIAAELTARET